MKTKLNITNIIMVICHTLLIFLFGVSVNKFLRLDSIGYYAGSIWFLGLSTVVGIFLIIDTIYRRKDNSLDLSSILFIKFMLIVFQCGNFAMGYVEQNK